MSRAVEFGAYVARRRLHLFRSAWLLCGDPHRAEDLVQDTLTKLYLAWPRVSKADNVDGYVRRTLVNANIDDRRRPWRREQPADVLPDGPAPSDDGDNDDDLWAALKALPAGQRRVVVLRHYWGLTIDETAADLGITPGTVKSQTSAALTSLRRALDPSATDPGPRMVTETTGGSR